MKYMILLGDGMADNSLDILDGKTPLEYAHTPNMDRIAAEGTLGRIDTIPEGMTPGSDVANLSVLGYDPKGCYTGRAPLEAVNMGISLSADDVAFRCNLVTFSDGDHPVMADFTSGHITSSEAKRILVDLQDFIGSEQFTFYPGVGYRHLMIWKGGDCSLEATPPHDISGRPVAPYLPQGPGADVINNLIRLSREFLPSHEVNVSRKGRGLNPANAIWLWGQGKRPLISPLTERFQIRGGMISAVDLLNGIGIVAGMKVIPVEGATGYTDTNYQGKALRALSSLNDLDFVFVHVEAPDEMGHEGNLKGKIKAIEDFDEKVVGTVLQGIERLGPFRIAVLSDHPTPISIKTHSAEPSPFAVLSSEREENQCRGVGFGEKDAVRVKNIISPGHLFLETFLGDWRSFVDKNNH